MRIRQQRTRQINISKKMMLICLCMILMVSIAGCGGKKKENLTITNVSYDPTREFYEKYNKDFIKYYKNKYGKKVEVIQSHGGSGSQARSVVEGSNGDVVTLALEHDISLIEQTGLINKGWQKRFSNDSAPYTSTIVFLVRKGNKKNIKDWNDLVKKGVEVITPDPKSSGGACWNFLAAYGYALDTYRDQKKEEQFLTKLYQNVSVMDSGARGSTTTFVENKKGDVLIAWENEALQTVKNYPGKYEIITPSISILAQPSVSLVDDNVNVNGTKKIATEYLKYLYSDKAQKLAAEEGYRPSNQTILKQYKDKFNLNMKLYKISDFGGWDQALQTLLLFMVIDWLTGGVLLPVVFGKSPKSQNGTLESRVGFKGLCRKGMMLFYVLIAAKLDLLLGVNYVRDTVCIGFIVNELVSIVENAGLMGMPMPEGIQKVIDIMKRESERN